VRSNYNRQARRASICIGARRPRGRKRVISPGRVALTAHGPCVAEVAAWIGDEIELPAEISELLSIDLLAPAHYPIDGRTLERAAKALTGGVRGR
jgi:hypothetical protein